MDFIQIFDEGAYITMEFFCKELIFFEITSNNDSLHAIFYFKKKVDKDLKCLRSHNFTNKDDLKKWIETYIIPKYQQGKALLDKKELAERVEVLEDSLKFLCGGKEYQQAKEDFEEKK